MTPLVLTEAELPPEMLALIGDACRIVVWQGAQTDPAVLAQAEGFLTYGHPDIGPAQMDRLPKLRTISNFGVGVDHIDLQAALERNIVVGNTPGFVDGATADMAMALVLAIGRNLVVVDRYARSAEFTTYNPSLLHGQEVHGQTMGIVGMGAIGTKVARRAAAFDMEILYHNRKPDPQSETQVGASYVMLAELLGRADYVVMNVPLTPQTRHMIGREAFRQMKPSAFFINVARGAVVDHDALNHALAEGWIAGAALDVTDPEPLPRDHPLLGRSNVIITPHLGSATQQTRAGMYRRTVDNLIAGLRGEPLPSELKSTSP